jgi:hypothetical protein
MRTQIGIKGFPCLMSYSCENQPQIAQIYTDSFSSVIIREICGWFSWFVAFRSKTEPEIELELTGCGGAVRAAKERRAEHAAVLAEVDVIEKVGDLRRERDAESRRLTDATKRAATGTARAAAGSAALRATTARRTASNRRWLIRTT